MDGTTQKVEQEEEERRGKKRHMRGTNREADRRLSRKGTGAAAACDLQERPKVPSRRLSCAGYSKEDVTAIVTNILLVPCSMAAITTTIPFRL